MEVTVSGALTLLILAVLIAYFSMSWWMPSSWYRNLLYPEGKPNLVAQRLNQLSDWVSSMGLVPSWMVSLETKGRRTGKTTRVPLVVVRVGDNQYLVSMLGEAAHWVRNVRASHGEALLRRGATEFVRLEEVPVAERAPILRAYLRRAPGARPHFDIDMDASLEEFERVAGKYPVFRILPR